jgi:hypothetical protein
MATDQTTGEELQDLDKYPAAFQQWVGRKVSITEIAKLAAQCHATAESFDAKLRVCRALALLFESWNLWVKGVSSPADEQS